MTSRINCVRLKTAAFGMIAAALICGSAILGSTARIMAYNVLSYTGNDPAKEAALRTVIESAGPDLLMTEEIQDNAGYSDFLSDVLNYTTAGLWTGAPFSNQPTTNMDIALYFKTGLFTCISTQTINTSDIYGRRDVVEFVMRHEPSAIEFRVYGLHLKAGSNSDNATERGNEAAALRSYLNTLGQTPFVVMGDYNFYNSGEAGWQALTDSTASNNGRLFDPINRVGYWHNNSSFSDVHTQSPRGGSFGGMDDRFDFLLVSSAILEDNDCNYVSGTYTVYGNDGNHFNQAINEGNNAVVPPAIANALVAASDHLPVIMSLEFDDIMPSDTRIIISEIMANPSAVSDSYGEWFEVLNADTVSVDFAGWTVKDAGTDMFIVAESVLVEPGGYAVFGRNGNTSQNGGVNVDVVLSGFNLSNTSDEIILYDSQGGLVDAVEYTLAFPLANGVSMHIRDFFADNGLAENWYLSTTPYGDGDLGTPGAPWSDSLRLGEDILVPDRVTLSPAYPNPFNPATTVPVTIQQAGYIKVAVYNLQGQIVAVLFEGLADPGRHQFRWDGSGYSSGLYFVQARIGQELETGKILLLK